MIGCVQTTYLKKITTLLFINSSTSTKLIENTMNVLVDENGFLKNATDSQISLI
ncbi:hypothetical protein IQ05_00829 [Flavobacterium tiangeerense]|uniref:Uncharacterized protein n=1 Tax=Flavobacterium tiangeerense TaxID=459471 RepID=A0ABY3FLD5_9FLAO|nr:hypothetical protein IQ05_00829 [Flavobacterium tiangeerense]